MKKGVAQRSIILGIGVVMLLIFSLILVSAADPSNPYTNTPASSNSPTSSNLPDPTTVAGNFFSAIGNGLKKLDFTSSTDPTQSALLIKFLFGVLVFLIIFEIAGTFFGNGQKKIINFIFSFAATLLAVWFIPIGLIAPMLNPYQALGITILAIIPFVLIFQFTTKFVSNLFLARVVWLFYAAWCALLFMQTYMQAPVGTAGRWYAGTYFIFMLVGIALTIIFPQIYVWLIRGKLKGETINANKNMDEAIAGVALFSGAERKIADSNTSGGGI